MTSSPPASTSWTPSPRLLVLDNCEHLLDAVRDLVSELLGRCPEVTLLTTSREPLGLAEEVVVRLAPLPTPATTTAAEALPDVAAVAVFLDRAHRVRPDLAFSSDELREVAEIVRRLEGLPLAIELAAGRLSTFAPAALALRLDRALDLLGNRALHARHRTLRATVAWSYDLLTDEEQRLFRHLAAFADGVDLVAVEGVATALGLVGDAGDLLARLVDASMVEAGSDPSGRTRYRLLETLRAFGRDRLVAAREDDSADRHVVGWAVELAAWAERTALTAREAVVGPVLRRELGNLRAAWRLARARGDLDAATAMAVSLAEIAYWQDLREVRALATELVDDPALAGHPFEARVWGHASHDAYLRGDAVEAERLARHGLASAGDAEGRRVCLAAVGEASLSRGAWDDAVTYDLAALGLADRPGPSRAWVPSPRCTAATPAAPGSSSPSSRPARCRPCSGSPPTSRPRSTASRAAPTPRRQGYTVAMDHARSVGSTFLEAIAAVGLASLRSRSGRIGAALVGYREVIDHWAAGGNWSHQWVTLRNLADLLRALDDAGSADLLDAAADRAPDAHDDPRARGRVPPGRAPDREQALVLARTAIARHLAGHDSAVHAG